MLSPDEKDAFQQILTDNRFHEEGLIRRYNRRMNRRPTPDVVVEHRHVLLSNRATAAMLIGVLAVAVLLFSGGHA